MNFNKQITLGSLFDGIGTYYGAIMVDPPWPERGGGKIKRGADRHYKLMTIRQIQALTIPALPDAHLYLWATNNYLKAAIETMEVWGFRHVSAITWVKGEVNEEGEVKLGRVGLGQYFRGLTEHCLFGVRGKVPYKLDPITGKRMQGKTVIVAPRGRHSEKPEEIYSMIERVSFGPFLEMFARTVRPGWDAWGDQVTESNLKASVTIDD